MTPFRLVPLASLLLLAACGQTPPPPLVVVNVAAPITFNDSAGTVLTQGITLNGADQHITVTVRDARGQVVRFNGATFDPTAQGTDHLTLNTANNFHQAVALPQGTYTFEHAVHDDVTGHVLLGYGPAGENAAVISAASAGVRLKSHAVLDVAGSALQSDRPIASLPSGTTVNLQLRAVTALASLPDGRPPVRGVIPTSDLGPVTYELGSSTDGTLNGAGSRVGINVTARGDVTDATLNVSATFHAWVADAAGQAASWQPVTLTYAQAIDLGTAP